VDAGIRDASEARAFLARHKRAQLVLGSESLASLSGLKDYALSPRIVLSLDFRGDELLGPCGIWDLPQLWPARVIVMTLARVGSNLGPEFARLAKVKRHAPEKMIFAAGGLRGAFDLIRLKEAGLSGVLVASALHDGRLTGADLGESGE
jgi:phosphoribosylformimino-5-aminoimidazole carboxamide ribotide isomerase